MIGKLSTGGDMITPQHHVAVSSSISKEYIFLGLVNLNSVFVSHDNCKDLFVFDPTSGCPKSCILLESLQTGLQKSVQNGNQSSVER